MRASLTRVQRQLLQARFILWRGNLIVAVMIAMQMPACPQAAPAGTELPSPSVLEGVVDLDGRAQNPLATPPGSKASVLVFLANECPISNRYSPELRRLFLKFSPSNVVFTLVHPDPSETPEAIKTHAHDYGLSMKIVRDLRGTLVKRSQVTITPEAAVFAPDGRLVYHGRIDDRHVDFGKERPAAIQHDLEEALLAILAGQPVPRPVTRAVGCYISAAK